LWVKQQGNLIQIKGIHLGASPEPRSAASGGVLHPMGIKLNNAESDINPFQNLKLLARSPLVVRRGAVLNDIPLGLDCF
jgi:hypothetical protein